MKLPEIASRPRVCLVLAMTAATTFPVTATAHVKWFCSIADVTRAPIPARDVLTPFYVACLCGFLLMTFTGFLLDGWVARRWPGVASSGARLAKAEEMLLRLAISVYFFILWNGSAVVLWLRGDAILTPELLATITWMGWVQFAVAILVISQRTCILAAAGICILYIAGIVQYGIFHMADYVFFPGIASYLALTTLRTPCALRLRVPVLAGGLAFSLMWTAVEKFVYPQWTAEVVLTHPNLTMGFAVPVVIVIAGFVEFTLAFYLVTGRGLLRLGAAGYALIFLSAMPEFGHLDVAGHLPILGILGVLVLHGASPLQDALRLPGRGLALNAAATSFLYLASLTGLAAMYYGLQWVEYG